MSALNEGITNTTSIQTRMIQYTNGCYDYPILRSTVKYEGQSTDYQHAAHHYKVKQMNYRFNPGLHKGKAFKQSAGIDTVLSPEDKLINADFNKMRYGNRKYYRDDIKDILQSAHNDKYERIRELLREEMWNRSNIKTTKSNYYTPSYDSVQMPKSFNTVINNNDHEIIPSAKDLLLPKLPMIKKLSGQIVSRTNQPFLTMQKGDIIIEKEAKMISRNKTDLNEPSSNALNDDYLNINTLQINAKQKNSKQIDSNSIRDFKLKSAIQSFQYSDNDINIQIPNKNK